MIDGRLEHYISNYCRLTIALKAQNIKTLCLYSFIRPSISSFIDLSIHTHKGMFDIKIDHKR